MLVAWPSLPLLLAALVTLVGAPAAGAPTVPAPCRAAAAGAQGAGGEHGARCREGRRAIFTSPQPACDALGLADEDGEIAERDLLRDGEPITLAGPAFGDCAPPEKPRAVVDCNDERSRPWVGEMVGTCDMPSTLRHGQAGRHHLLLGAAGGRAAQRGHGARDRRERSRELPSLCEGSSCLPESVPLRPSQTGFEHAGWAALAAALLAPPRSPPLRVRFVDEPPPPSASREPAERPPRAWPHA